MQQALKRFSLISKNVRAAALPLLFKSISLTYGEEKWLGPRNAKFDPVVWTHVVWTHVKVVRLEVSQRSIRKLSTEKKSGHWQIWMNYWQLLLKVLPPFKLHLTYKHERQQEAILQSPAYAYLILLLDHYDTHTSTLSALGMKPSTAPALDFGELRISCNSPVWPLILAIRTHNENADFSLSIAHNDDEGDHDGTTCPADAFISTFGLIGSGRLKLLGFASNCLLQARNPIALSSLSWKCSDMRDLTSLAALLSRSAGTLNRLHVSSSWEDNAKATPTAEQVCLPHLRYMSIKIASVNVEIIHYLLSMARSPIVKEIKMLDMLSLELLPSLDIRACARLLGDYVKASGGQVIYEDCIATYARNLLVNICETWHRGKETVLSERIQLSATFRLDFITVDGGPLTSTWSEQAHGLVDRCNPNHLIPAYIRTDLNRLSVLFTSPDDSPISFPACDVPVVHFPCLQYLSVTVECTKMYSANRLAVFLNHIRASKLRNLSVSLLESQAVGLERHIDVIATHIMYFPSLEGMEIYANAKDIEADAFSQLAESCSHAGITLTYEPRNW